MEQFLGFSIFKPFAQDMFFVQSIQDQFDQHKVFDQTLAKGQKETKDCQRFIKYGSNEESNASYRHCCLGFINVFLKATGYLCYQLRCYRDCMWIKIFSVEAASLHLTGSSMQSRMPVL